MRVQLAFGRDKTEVEVPDRNVVSVLDMPQVPPLEDGAGAVLDAIDDPIGTPRLVDLAERHETAVVAVCDITRPVPNGVLLPPILDALQRGGIDRDRVTILIATGLHQPNEGDDLVELLGPATAKTCHIVNHRATEAEQHVHLGQTSGGTDIEIDARYVEASLKIATGFIEPHLVAGFSGGRKLCGIGCGSQRTIRSLHAPRIIEHPNSIEGQLDGNPLHEELTEIAGRVGMDFIVNVTLDHARRVTGVFAGHFDGAFRAGCNFARQALEGTVEREVDIVITSGGGYPQDISYYHTGKAFCGARHICKPGGTIIALSECSRGLGKSAYAEFCREIESVDAFLDRYVLAGPEAYNCAQRNDQWQIHNLTRALRKCHCVLVDGALTSEQRGMLLHQATPSFDEAMADALDRHGRSARIAVIPAGPNVLARVG
ncbi:MAG: nickel-dependent lactate racemase [bacterium]|nr:nickel-dependent lactate racemase [bacterium]